MVYLIWGIFNFVLFVFFITICFKATKLIREELGLFPAVVFVFGILSFSGNSSSNDYNKEPNSNQIKTWKFSPENSLNKIGTDLVDVILEKTLIAEYNLGISYSKEKKKESKCSPVSAYSSTSGITCGTLWIPKSIIVTQTNTKNKFEYSVNGEVEWKLLGLTLFTQIKQYKGITKIK
jgi:hypothetical protein